MPVMTAPRLPNVATTPFGHIEINTPAIVEEQDVTKTDNDIKTGVNSTAVGAAGSGKSRSAVTPEERERQVKLGLLLVRLGTAKENSVFGAKGLVVSPRDLLVINRSEDDVRSPQPFKWYNPLSWFFFLPRTSPMVWSSTAATAATNKTDVVTPPAPTAVGAATTTKSVDATPKTKKIKKRSLPVVNMQPLQGEDTLEPVVQEERAKLLKEGEEVHRVLDSIEETRYTYLVPAQDIRCETEVMSVLRCYEQQNVATQNRLFSGDSGSSTAYLPPVTDVLQCGPVVALLKQCAEGMVAAYSEADGKS